MIAYVAPGVGRGHSTRAAAVCRHLDNAAVVIRNTAAYNEPLEQAGIGHHVLHAERTLEEMLELLDPELVVWDTDLSIVATALACPVVYLWRHGRAADAWAVKNVAIDWPCPSGFEDFWPVLSVDRFASRRDARRRLGVDEGRVVLALDSVAVPGDIAAHFDTAPTVEWSEWPAAHVLRGADLVLGAAGCNLWSEVHHLGLDAEWVALSFDQEIRLAHGPAPTGRPDRSAELASLILTTATGSS